MTFQSNRKTSSVVDKVSTIRLERRQLCYFTSRRGLSTSTVQDIVSRTTTHFTASLHKSVFFNPTPTPTTLPPQSPTTRSTTHLIVPHCIPTIHQHTLSIRRLPHITQQPLSRLSLRTTPIPLVHIRIIPCRRTSVRA